jgi:hypothetical protein
MNQTFEQTIQNIVRDWETDTIENYLEVVRKITCDIEPFEKIHWFYKEEEAFCKKHMSDPESFNWYSGVVVPRPDIETDDFHLFDDGIVIITDYPCEKTVPVVAWVSFKSLATDENLARIYK